MNRKRKIERIATIPVIIFCGVFSAFLVYWTLTHDHGLLTRAVFMVGAGFCTLMAFLLWMGIRIEHKLEEMRR